MSCSNDEIDGARKAAKLIMPVGSSCTYRYTCPFDAENMARQSVMECGENGKWSGELPDCTETDELVS